MPLYILKIHEVKSDLKLQIQILFMLKKKKKAHAVCHVAAAMICTPSLQNAKRPIVQLETCDEALLLLACSFLPIMQQGDGSIACEKCT